jgi:basic amino acid/polyamine antiporter, APA family
VIGSSIFGLPSELTRLLGSSSVIAVVLGGLAMGVMMACMAEVASRFSEAGGAYLYARTAFGPLIGIQVAWFSWLSRIASAAAGAALFGIYMEGLFPKLETTYARVLVIGAMLSVLAVLNYVGVKSGTHVSTATLIARLVPLAILVATAVPLLARTSRSTLLNFGASSGANWFEAMLLISFLYGGYETAMMALGEVKDPARSAPFALAAGLLVCIAVYSLCQWVVVATVGASASPRPLADAAARVLGPGGALMISVAALISTVGYLAACVLNVPRLMFAISEQGDLPRWFNRVHPQFQTPYVAIIVFAVLVFLLAVTGGFRFAVLISAGARLITYGSACAALIPLRRRSDQIPGFRLAAGPLFAVMGVLMAVVMVSAIRSSGAEIMLLTFVIALANWLWVLRRRSSAAAATKHSR